MINQCVCISFYFFFPFSLFNITSMYNCFECSGSIIFNLWNALVVIKRLSKWCGSFHFKKNQKVGLFFHLKYWKRWILSFNKCGSLSFYYWLQCLINYEWLFDALGRLLFKLGIFFNFMIVFWNSFRKNSE